MESSKSSRDRPNVAPWNGSFLNQTPTEGATANLDSNGFQPFLPQNLPNVRAIILRGLEPSRAEAHLSHDVLSAPWFPSLSSQPMGSYFLRPPASRNLENAEFSPLRMLPAQTELNRETSHVPSSLQHTRTRIQYVDSLLFIQAPLHMPCPVATHFASQTRSSLPHYSYDILQQYPPPFNFNMGVASNGFSPFVQPPGSRLIRSGSNASLYQESNGQPTLPPVQSWPTDTTSSRRRRSTHVESSPTPAPLDQTPLDERSLRKQEIYRQKGEMARARKKEGLPAIKRKGMKRKQKTAFQELVPSSSDLRHEPTTSRLLHSEQQLGSELDSMDWQPDGQSYTQNNVGIYHNYEAPVKDEFWLSTSLRTLPLRYTPFRRPVFVSQIYEDYKEPIFLCEVAAGDGRYDFAQSFLEEIFAEKGLYDKSSLYRWHAHTSKGFIQNGNRLSFIVLRNAVDPFEWDKPSSSTSSIGVYSRYENEADQIHWKTFTPDMLGLLQEYLDSGAFQKKFTWYHNMEKASERRFHRAYWLSANMRPLGGMLNRNRVDHPAHDAMDDGEEVLDFLEEDLQSSWENVEVSEEEAQTTWAKILQDGEDGEDVDLFASEFEHMVTGYSEWDEWEPYS